MPEPVVEAIPVPEVMETVWVLAPLAVMVTSLSGMVKVAGEVVVLGLKVTPPEFTVQEENL